MYTLKSLIFTSFVNKIRLVTIPLPGATEQPPVARCVGAKTCKKLQLFEKHFSVLGHSSPTIPEPHPELKKSTTDHLIGGWLSERYLTGQSTPLNICDV